MADYLDAQVTRLKKQRKENPYLSMARHKLDVLAPEFRGLKRKLDTSLRSDGTSLPARLQATQEVGDQYKGAVSDVYGEADAKNKVRMDEITRQIDELEFRKDIEAEEKAKLKKKLEDDKKAMLWKAGGTVLGAGAGFLAGGFGGAKIGAKIGGGFGGMAGADVGDFDINMAYEGLTDTLSGVGDLSTLSSEKALTKELMNFTDQTKDWDYEKLLGEYQKMRMLPTSQLLEYLRGMNLGNPSGTPLQQMPNYMGY